jgi:hypothetical protein
MSNYLNFSVTTKDELKDWVMKRLGWPLVDVEITDEQLINCIDDAVEEFTKYVVQDIDYYALDLSTYETSGYTMPNNVTAIFALEESNIMNGANGGVNTLFSIQNQMWNAGIFPDFMSGGGSGSWVTYEASLQYLDLVKRMTASGFEFNYNERKQLLTLIPDPSVRKMKGYVVLGCHTIREDDCQYGENWVKRMTLALVKQIVGTIRQKYKDATLLGGGTLNSEMKDEGRNDEDELRRELHDTYRMVGFFIG